jgi:hypothetical protein
MELASKEDVQRYLAEAEEFIKQPWQSMFAHQSPKLAIIEFLAYKEGKTVYECHLKTFAALNLK